MPGFNEIDELMRDFLVESYENLDRLDRDFVALETNPSEFEKLASIFRTIHTIKGTCGCLGLGKLEAVAHVGENLLSRLREGQMLMDTEITTALLRLVDAVREILRHIETTGNEGNGDYSAVCRELVRLNERPTASSSKLTAPGDSSSPITALHVNHDVTHASVEEVAFPTTNTLSETHKADILITPELEEVSVPVSHKSTADPLIESTSAVHPNSAPVQNNITRTVVQEATDETHGDSHPVVEAVPANGTAPAAQPKEKVDESLLSNAIRVDVKLLDKLMNLVGELVLARNQVLQHSSAQKNDPSLLRTAQRLNLITTELQEGVMKTRMQPIGNLWNKFPRIVRDVATSCHKKVRIEMEGRETELDKTIIEAIKDPLTHVIRNSVDHGVESPAQRLAAGKPEEGRLFMRAYHEGGQVIIEISDDGKGIDAEVIKRKAAERGLISAEQAAKMSEREAINLIFLPGFSTSEQITNVSGRGVGMDVVKTNVERIGGTVDVKTRIGEGTTLRIKIPLTLAIIPALIITSGGEQFAIPQVSLLELVRLDECSSGIEKINGTPLYRLRGNLLPLVYLNQEMKLKLDGPNGRTAGKPANIVVLRGGERQFGLVVDQINDTEEIVVKPLGKQLKGVSVFAGATIMGDGRVALILDVMGLAQRANVVSQSSDEANHDAAAKASTVSTDRQMLLLCKLQGGQRMVIPLSLVARLEEFPRSGLESAGGQSVVQYRGQIMPLIDVAEVLADKRSRARMRLAA